MMPVSPDILRLLLLFCLLGMELLAAGFLSRRRMTFWQYAGWGLLAVVVPVLGPFLVILLTPGRPAVIRRSPRQRRRARHARLPRALNRLGDRFSLWKNPPI